MPAPRWNRIADDLSLSLSLFLEGKGTPDNSQRVIELAL